MTSACRCFWNSECKSSAFTEDSIKTSKKSSENLLKIQWNPVIGQKKSTGVQWIIRS